MAITKARGLSIGQMAETAAVNLETIRYYERIRLMPKPDRTTAGHRSYSSEDARRLTFIRRARELGFSLDDIRALLALAQPGKSSCGDVKAIASAHLADVREKMADLARLERTLAETVKKCVGGRAPTCPVLEVLATRPAALA
jgi:MerR family transcriptional regulator, mercuric resistance operon regulatory protein